MVYRPMTYMIPESLDAYVLGRKLPRPPQRAPAGDYVDLLALMDVLAVPIICGGGDLGQVSNFNFSSIEVKIFAASPEALELVDPALVSYGFDEAENSVRSDPQPQISLMQRELVKDQNYKPRRTPVTYTNVEVGFNDWKLGSWRANPQLNDPRLERPCSHGFYAVVSITPNASARVSEGRWPRPALRTRVRYQFGDQTVPSLFPITAFRYGSRA